VTSGSHKRLAREEKTVAAMVGIYCRGNHARLEAGGLCPDCRELLDYASARLEKCRFQADKPNCADCPVHCYKPSMREKVKEVMRYAGPRMMFRHPVLAFFHLWNGVKKKPALK